MKLLLLVPVLVSVAMAVKPLLKRAEGESAMQPVTWYCVQRVEATTTWKNIRSRGYPKALFVKDSRCTWRIQAAKGWRIRLSFNGLDLYADDPAHCSANYVEIIDENLSKTQGRFCGKNVPGDIVSKGRKVRIDFQAEPGRSPTKGFMISFKATSDKAGFYGRSTLGQPSPPPVATMKPFVYQVTERQSNDGATSLAIVEIIGIVIGVLLVVVVIIFIWRRRYNGKRKKKRQKELDRSENSSKMTQIDPRLPQNEVDPFERVAQMTATGPGEDKPETEDPVYINCQAPALPMKNRLPFRQQSLPVERQDRFPNNLGRSVDKGRVNVVRGRKDFIDSNPLRKHESSARDQPSRMNGYSNGRRDENMKSVRTVSRVDPTLSQPALQDIRGQKNMRRTQSTNFHAGGFDKSKERLANQPANRRQNQMPRYSGNLSRLSSRIHQPHQSQESMRFSGKHPPTIKYPLNSDSRQNPSNSSSHLSKTTSRQQISESRKSVAAHPSFGRLSSRPIAVHGLDSNKDNRF